MGTYGVDDLTSKVVALDARVTTQQRVIANLEARIGACEAATIQRVDNNAGSSAAGGSAGRLVAARVAALEGAHQAEISELRRSLDEAVAISREQEHLQRRQRSSTREFDQHVDDAEGRATALRENLRAVEQQIERLRQTLDSHSERATSLTDVVTSADSSLNAQERRAQSLEEVVEVATAGLARLGTLLDTQERRTADLGNAIGASSEKVGSPPPAATGSNEPVWEALRELQELVVHESEHRAAGMREVLAVMGKSMEQLRGEQERHAIDVEGKCRSDCRRLEQRLTDSLGRHTEYEKRAEALEHRITTLSSGMTADKLSRDEKIINLETQVREARMGRVLSPGRVVSPGGSRLQTSRVQSPRAAESLTPRALLPSETYHAGCASNASVISAPNASQMVTSQSLKRLEALEVRYDKSCSGQAPGNAIALPTSGMAAPLALTAPPMPETKPSMTEDTLGKLRGQLEGLRSELAGDDNTARLSARATEPIQDQGRVPESTSYTMRPLPADRCFAAAPAQVMVMPSTLGVGLSADRQSCSSGNLQVPPTLLAPSFTAAMASTAPATMQGPIFAQETVVSRPASAAVCSCGSPFLEGSNFCPRCGAIRPLNGMAARVEPVAALTSGETAPGYAIRPVGSGVVPGAMVGLDLKNNGHADLIIAGPDVNRDGIPDILQQPNGAIFAVPEAISVQRQPSQPQTPVASARRMVTTGPAKVGKMQEQPPASEPCQATEPVAFAMQKSFQQRLHEPWNTNPGYT